MAGRDWGRAAGEPAPACTAAAAADVAAVDHCSSVDPGAPALCCCQTDAMQGEGTAAVAVAGVGVERLEGLQACAEDG